MAMNPIGITFLPSEQNQAQGLRQGNLEGDLGQALKILSLRLPRVLGARGAISSPELLNSPGSAGVATSTPQAGTNPSAAVFEALIRSMVGGGDPMASAGWRTPSIVPGGPGGSIGPSQPVIPRQPQWDPNMGWQDLLRAGNYGPGAPSELSPVSRMPGGKGGY